MDSTTFEVAKIPNSFVMEVKDLTPGCLLADPDGGAYVLDARDAAYGNVTLYLYADDGWQWDETHEGETPVVLLSKGDQAAFFEMRNKATMEWASRHPLCAAYIASQMPTAAPQADETPEVSR